MSSYEEFLERKRSKQAPTGIQIGELPDYLFPHQEKVVRWAAKRGRAAVFLDTGVGKTVIQLLWAENVRQSGSALVICPLSIARQTEREAARFGINAHVVRHQDEITGPGIWITNYEMEDKFDPAKMNAVVLDECFAAGTPVDTPDGPRPIEDIKVGDQVISAAGVSTVEATHQRTIGPAFKITFNNHTVTCSANHPWFTDRGWVPASQLNRDDLLVSTEYAGRLLRERTYDHAARLAYCLSVECGGIGDAATLPADEYATVDNVEPTDGGAFYDLEVDLHPSFSVHGYLVHNSSILKNHEGKTKARLIERWKEVPFRLCCTATPAPNDHTELANHAEFLGVMSRVEMLAAFFVHDDDGWRLKGHASEAMFDWMSTWAIAARKPSDITFNPEDDIPYQLPPLNIHGHIIETERNPWELMPESIGGVGGRAKTRRETMPARLEKAAELLTDGPAVAWCGLNAEAEGLTKLVDGAANLHGTLSADEKTDIIERFVTGDIRVLITKPSIAGFGLNFQHANTQVFVGINDSWESYHQAIRRSWRFGQDKPVDVHIVVSDKETEIVTNVQKKEGQANHIIDSLVKALQERNK